MEKSVNKVELSGFAGMSPEIKDFKNGKQMIRFSLATSSSYKNQKDEWVRDTTWHNIVMWDKLAGEASEKIKKGSFVSLNGKITSRTFTGKNGIKQNLVEINAIHFQVIPIEKKQN